MYCKLFSNIEKNEVLWPNCLQTVHYLCIIHSTIINELMSVTYQPKKRKRSRTHGFLKRKSTTAGKRVLKSRRQKGRKRLAV